MPDPLTPAWIASRLTPAQRAALLWLLPDGEERYVPPHLREEMAEMRDLHFSKQDVTVHLTLVGLPEWVGVDWRATALGLRVRAVLEHNGE